jgi:hypothetical protein
MSLTDRRNLLRAGAAGAAAGAAVLLPEFNGVASAAAPVGPWEYVPPGSSIQAAINKGPKPSNWAPVPTPPRPRSCQPAGAPFTASGSRPVSPPARR